MPSPEDCGLLQGLLLAVDAEREAQTIAWGSGRLEALIGREDPDLLARFSRQCASWSVALQAAWDAPILTRDLLAAAQAKAGAMQRAWRALDARAREAGHREIAPWVWEVPLEDGSVAALVQTDAEVGKVLAEGRFVSVYTAREIGHVIDALPKALQVAKVEFPGARVTGSREPRKPLPNDLNAPPFDPERGDEIPFGQEAR
jgi:hypothetical protein